MYICVSVYVWRIKGQCDEEEEEEFFVSEYRTSSRLQCLFLSLYISFLWTNEILLSSTSPSSSMFSLSLLSLCLFCSATFFSLSLTCGWCMSGCIYYYIKLRPCDQSNVVWSSILALLRSSPFRERNERANEFLRQWRLFFLSLIKISLRIFWNSPRELWEKMIDLINKFDLVLFFPWSLSVRWIMLWMNEKHFTCSTDE